MAANSIDSMHRFWEAFNAHRLDGWDEVCTPDFVNHDPGFPTADADLATIKRYVGELIAAFPDMTSTEEDVVDGGDKIAVRRTLRGTHEHEFMGVPASGASVEVGGVWLTHTVGGLFAEQWVYFDAAGLLTQIGALPSPD